MCKIKICGLNRFEDIDAVNRALPDFVGFVFAGSRRRVDAKTAAALKEKLDNKIESVGVFVNQDISFVSDLYKNGIINLAQLHGDEDGKYIRELKEACGCRVIKSAAVGRALPSLVSGADYILFDTASEQRGGTGETFNWNILKEYRWPPFFLAGGLTAMNVENAIRMLAPFCVDVSSGVETDGLKDPAKIAEIVKIVKGMENNE